MLVHGYTENKLIARVDLPLQTILDKQIDLWHLDLFDKDPVVLKVGTEPLFFSKIKDVAFAYIDGGRVFVCFDDGTGQTCIECINYSVDDSHVSTNKFKVSELSFGQHLRRYLTGAKDPDVIAHRRGFQAQLLESPNTARLGGDKLTFRCKKFAGGCRSGGPRRPIYPKQSPIIFRGEMFREVALSIGLPHEVEWALQTLGEFRPAVIYEAVWGALKRQPSEGVELVFDFDSRRAAERVLAKLPDVTYIGSMSTGDKDWQRYQHAGHTYNLTLRANHTDLPTYLDTYEDSTFSVHGVHCSKRGEIRGTRISLYDVVRDVATPLSAAAQEWCRETLAGASSTQIWFPLCGGCPGTPNAEQAGKHSNKVFTVSSPLDCGYGSDENDLTRHARTVDQDSKTTASNRGQHFVSRALAA